MQTRDARQVLMKNLQALGYPKEFGYVLANELKTEKLIYKLAHYVYHAQPQSAEEIADEMLALCANRDTWRDKKFAQYYNDKVTQSLNEDWNHNHEPLE